MATATNKFQKIGDYYQKLLGDLIYPDSTEKVFKKVLLGFPEDKTATFGDGVIAINYVKGAKDYGHTFARRNIPRYIESVIAFIIKGNTQAKYAKAVMIMDLITEHFEKNPDWYSQIKEDDGSFIVRETEVVDSALSVSPSQRALNIVCVFSLKHHVYK